MIPTSYAPDVVKFLQSFRKVAELAQIEVHGFDRIGCIPEVTSFGTYGEKIRSSMPGKQGWCLGTSVRSKPA